MDAFKVLGIGRDADTRQIQVAYRRGALSLHPDIGGDAEAFVRLQDAYHVARSMRAAKKVEPSRPPPPESRFAFAEIAYRFELGRPGHTTRSFIAAVDVELYPGTEPVHLGSESVELIADLITSEADLPLIVTTIVDEIDDARRSDS